MAILKPLPYNIYTIKYTFSLRINKIKIPPCPHIPLPGIFRNIPLSKTSFRPQFAITKSHFVIKDSHLPARSRAHWFNRHNIGTLACMQTM